MGKPKSWKDLLKKNCVNIPKGHNWIIVGGGGGTEARSWSPIIDRPAKPRYIKYKCTKCNSLARKEIGGEFLLEKSEHQDLTCDEVVIHDIIV